MKGCFSRLGCLVVLIAAALLYFKHDQVVALYLTRDRWLPELRERLGMGRGAETPVATEGEWAPVSSAGAARARQQVQALASRGGPVYANIAPADLAAYVYDELRRQLPPSAENVEASVIGDQLHVRALVNMKDLGGSSVLGPLAQFLGDRDTVQFGGTLEIVRPGLAQFRVRQIRLRQLAIPSPLIPQILRRLNRGVRLDGVAEDALPLVVPPYIADVRIDRGRVTLYKNVQ